MADILIRGLDMPLGKTELIVFPSGVVQVYDSRENYLGKAQAVPLPEGHGKIIDGDALWENMTVEQSEAFQKGLSGTIELFEMLEAAIPILPAEGGENE